MLAVRLPISCYYYCVVVVFVVVVLVHVGIYRYTVLKSHDIRGAKFQDHPLSNAAYYFWLVAAVNCLAFFAMSRYCATSGSRLGLSAVKHDRQVHFPYNDYGLWIICALTKWTNDGVDCRFPSIGNVALSHLLLWLCLLSVVRVLRQLHSDAHTIIGIVVVAYSAAAKRVDLIAYTCLAGPYFVTSMIRLAINRLDPIISSDPVAGCTLYDALHCCVLWTNK